MDSIDVSTQMMCSDPARHQATCVLHHPSGRWRTIHLVASEKPSIRIRNATCLHGQPSENHGRASQRKCLTFGPQPAPVSRLVRKIGCSCGTVRQQHVEGKATCESRLPSLTVNDDEHDRERHKDSEDSDRIVEEAVFEDGHLPRLAHPDVPFRPAGGRKVGAYIHTRGSSLSLARIDT